MAIMHILGKLIDPEQPYTYIILLLLGLLCLVALTINWIKDSFVVVTTFEIEIEHDDDELEPWPLHPRMTYEEAERILEIG